MRPSAALLLALLACSFAPTAFAAGTVSISSPVPDEVFPDDPRPGFSGTAGEGTVTVEIFSGASANGTPGETVVRTVVDGIWSTQPETNLADGQYTLRVTQQDASATVTFWVDLRAPTPGINEPYDGSATEDRTPTIRGFRGTAPGDADEVTVDLYAGSATTPMESTTMADGATWEMVPSTELPDGDYTVVVSQEDDAGHLGIEEAGFTVDTTAPALTIELPATDTRFSTMSGVAGIATGDATKVLVEVFSGTTTEGAPVYTRNATVSEGRWSALTTLVEGVYTLRVTQTDWLDHATTLTRTFRRDVTDPALTVETPGEGSTVGPRPVFSGAAGMALGDATTVELSAGGAKAQIPVVDGRWSGTLPADLPARATTAVITQRDAAGNAISIRRRIIVSVPVSPRPFVSAPDTAAPKIGLPSRVTLRKRRFLAVVRVNEPATIVVTLKLGRRVLASRTVDEAGSVRLKPRRGALARLRRAKRRPTLGVRATDRSGNTTRVWRAVTVRRR